MKHLLLSFLLFMSVTGIQAQISERYTYYLVSDSIFEASDHTYLNRDTVDVYGFIPLTGDDQFIQITNKQFYVACYDAVTDSSFYLYAASVAFHIDETTGESIAYMGEWNPSEYNQSRNKGWKNVKNQDFSYYYLWWSMENLREETAYSFSGLETGMYYVKLEKEMMKTGSNPNDAVVLFAKMSDLNPLTSTYDYPIVGLYKYTEHTSTSYASSSSGTGYSRYGSLYNYNAFTMMYDLSHGSSSSSSSTSSTYYSWDYYVKMKMGSYDYLKTGVFKGMYLWTSLKGVYKNNQALVLYMPNDNTPYGMKKSDVCDDRFDTYWYDLVPYSSTERNWYCPETEPEEDMYMLIDVDNKRVYVISKAMYDDCWLTRDYDEVKFYMDYFYLNYEIEGNESFLMTPSLINEWIEKYGKLYADPDGAQELRDYMLNGAEKYYQNIMKTIDWLYLNYDDPTHICGLPELTADDINEYIDEYAKYYNDEEGAKALRKYAFGDTDVNDVTVDDELEEGAYYTLQGIKVNHTKKGCIYIRNGKKVFGED